MALIQWLESFGPKMFAWADGFFERVWNMAREGRFDALKNHWLGCAIFLMLAGFLIDQALYWARFGDQTLLVRAVRAVKRRVGRGPEAVTETGSARQVSQPSAPTATRQRRSAASLADSLVDSLRSVGAALCGAVSRFTSRGRRERVDSYEDPAQEPTEWYDEVIPDGEWTGAPQDEYLQDWDEQQSDGDEPWADETAGRDDAQPDAYPQQWDTQPDAYPQDWSAQQSGGDEPWADETPDSQGAQPDAYPQQWDIQPEMEHWAQSPAEMEPDSAAEDSRAPDEKATFAADDRMGGEPGDEPTTQEIPYTGPYLRTPQMIWGEPEGAQEAARQRAREPSRHVQSAAPRERTDAVDWGTPESEADVAADIAQAGAVRRVHIAPGAEQPETREPNPARGDRDV